MYRMMRKSIHTGDAIGIKSIWLWFLPIFILLGKRIYVEITLSQIDMMHNKCLYFILTLIGNNRTALLYDRKRREDGQPCAEWAIDVITKNF